MPAQSRHFVTHLPAWRKIHIILGQACPGPPYHVFPALLDVAQYSIEFIQAVVAQHQFALAGRTVPDFNPAPKRWERSSCRWRILGSTACTGAGFSCVRAGCAPVPRSGARTGPCRPPSARLRLLSRLQGQKGAGVTHFQIPVLHQAAHIVLQAHQAQQVGHRERDLPTALATSCGSARIPVAAASARRLPRWG